MVIAEMTIAVQFVKDVECRNVLRSERTTRMTRHVDPLPRRHVAEDFALNLGVAIFERADLCAHVDGLIGSAGFEIRDALLEFEQTLLAFYDHIHASALAPSTGSG